MDLGIGGGEILVIIIVAVILWGPARIVDISRTIGKTVHNLNKAASHLADQVTKEVEEEKRQALAGIDGGKASDKSNDH
jgi:sec-independent protein translocase protein TatA